MWLPINHMALTFHLMPNLAPNPPKARKPFQLEAYLQIILPILLYQNTTMLRINLEAYSKR